MFSDTEQAKAKGNALSADAEHRKQNTMMVLQMRNVESKRK